MQLFLTLLPATEWLYQHQSHCLFLQKLLESDSKGQDIPVVYDALKSSFQKSVQHT